MLGGRRFKVALEYLHRHIRSRNCIPSAGEPLRRIVGWVGWSRKTNCWSRALEVADWQLADAHVSKLHHHTGVGLLLNVLLVAVLQPLYRIDISQESLSCLVKVAGKGGCGRVACCCGKNIQVWIKEALEHGARLASFNIEDHLVVLFGSMHVLDGLVQCCCFENILTKCNKTLCSMICKVDENIVLGS